MNEIIHATVTKQNNFAAGTRLTGTWETFGLHIRLQVHTANNAPIAGLLTERMENVKVERVERADAVKVGDIFCMSWGYDQTNVNYFQVTRLTAKGACVREISQEFVTGTQGFMSSKVKPVPGKFLSSSQWCGSGNPETHRKIGYDGKGGASMSFGRYYWASRVSVDESTYCSWYA